MRYIYTDRLLWGRRLRLGLIGLWGDTWNLSSHNLRALRYIGILSYHTRSVELVGTVLRVLLTKNWLVHAYTVAAFRIALITNAVPPLTARLAANITLGPQAELAKPGIEASPRYPLDRKPVPLGGAYGIVLGGRHEVRRASAHPLGEFAGDDRGRKPAAVRNAPVRHVHQDPWISG